MTTTNSLTDRYVDATLRRAARGQRPDIEKELRASIADAVDDRVEAGTDPAEAEVAVLTELGDPAGSPRVTPTGRCTSSVPALFLDYTRLLTHAPRDDRAHRRRRGRLVRAFNGGEARWIHDR